MTPLNRATRRSRQAATTTLPSQSISIGSISCYRSSLPAQRRVNLLLQWFLLATQCSSFSRIEQGSILSFQSLLLTLIQTIHVLLLIPTPEGLIPFTNLFYLDSLI